MSLHSDCSPTSGHSLQLLRGWLLQVGPPVSMADVHFAIAGLPACVLRTLNPQARIVPSHLDDSGGARRRLSFKCKEFRQPGMLSKHISQQQQRRESVSAMCHANEQGGALSTGTDLRQFCKVFCACRQLPSCPS